MRESITINGIELAWHTDRGITEFLGVASASFWLRPSLVRMLAPLRDELGDEFFRLLVAHNSSLGTEQDYQDMVTVLGGTFEEGFLAWGRAVGLAGWGRFELAAFDPDSGTATVIVRNPWELVMQEELERPWGCPFLMGKVIGIFRHALGRPCWADERTYEEGGEHVVELLVHPSDKTLAGELSLQDQLAVKREQHLREEVERLGMQLHQAQKMEAIGQLTGGVAHDFNNLLTVVLGSLEMLVEDSGANQKICQLAEQAAAAAERASTLTHRLLAFGRRQTLVPKTVRASRLIAGMEDMLARTLGETVKLVVVRSGEEWACKVDAGQLESAILNLAINARDAMTDGGQLTIEVGNVTLDAAHPAVRDGTPPGSYVRLAVSDDGVGMPPEVAGKVLEPFFTTKEVGRGTGLGLSTVYGFAKQSGGDARVESAVGRGTTVEVLLPRAAAGVEEEPVPVEAEGEPAVEPEEPEPRLVLVVEDDEQVRSLSRTFLTRMGHRTLEALDARGALAVLEREPDVDLLFADVVLPRGADGVELAREARLRRPDLPILLTSGYAEDVVARGGRAELDVDLLIKPFTMEELATRLREALARVGVARGAGVEG